MCLWKGLSELGSATGWVFGCCPSLLSEVPESPDFMQLPKLLVLHKLHTAICHPEHGVLRLEESSETPRALLNLVQGLALGWPVSAPGSWSGLWCPALWWHLLLCELSRKRKFHLHKWFVDFLKRGSEARPRTLHYAPCGLAARFSFTLWNPPELEGHSAQPRTFPPEH